VKKRVKKLSLSSETLLGLTPQTLRDSVGGVATTPRSQCLTICVSVCGSCRPPCPISSPLTG
jgi:hypothetical protein